MGGRSWPGEQAGYRVHQPAVAALEEKVAAGLDDQHAVDVVGVAHRHRQLDDLPVRPGHRAAQAAAAGQLVGVELVEQAGQARGAQHGRHAQSLGHRVEQGEGAAVGLQAVRHVFEQGREPGGAGAVLGQAGTGLVDEFQRAGGKALLFPGVAGQALPVGQPPGQLGGHRIQAARQAVDLVAAPGRGRHRTSGVRGDVGQREIGAHCQHLPGCAQGQPAARYKQQDEHHLDQPDPGEAGRGVTVGPGQGQVFQARRHAGADEQGRAEAGEAGQHQAQAGQEGITVEHRRGLFRMHRATVRRYL